MTPHTAETNPAAEPAPKTVSADTAIEARIAAMAQGHRVEVLSERTEESQTFALPDGSFTTETSTGAVRVRDKNAPDGWRNVDLTLAKDDDGVIRPKSPVVPVEINSGDDKDAALVTADPSTGSSIGFEWDGAALPAPKLSGNRATYSDVEPGVDLVVEATRYGFEHYYVLTKKPADPAAAEVTLPVVSDGLTLHQTTPGDVSVVNGKGKKVGQLGEALVWDADTDPHTAPAADLPAEQQVADVQVDKTADGQQNLVLTPDPEFLEQATYPVTIDPSVTFGSPSDTFAASTYPTTNYGTDTMLRVGTYDSGTNKYRTYLWFAGQPIANTQILSATLQMWADESWNCGSNNFSVFPAADTPTTAGTTWNSQPALLSSTEYSRITVPGKGSGGCAAGWLNAGSVQPVIQFHADAGRSKFTLALRASEVNNLEWKRFSSSNGSHPPKLVVNYNRYPSVPPAPSITGSVSSGGNLYVGASKPTVTVKTTDADADKIDYQFQVFDANILTTDHVIQRCYLTGIVSGATASCALPTALADNTDRWIRAGYKDPHMSGYYWTAMRAFKTALAAPPKPTIACPSPYINGYWGDALPSANVSCTISVTGTGGNNAATAILYKLDSATSWTTVTSGVTKGSGGSVTVSVPKTAGAHQIVFASKQSAGLISTSTTHGFGYGPAAFDTTVTGVKTNDKVRLSATAQPLGSASSVTGKVQWRLAGNGGTDWTDGPAVPVTGSGTNPIKAVNFIWSTQTAKVDTSTGSSVTLNPRVPALLEVRICFTYTPGGTQCTDQNGAGSTVLRVPHAFGNGFPTADAGPGQVALWTGEFNTSDTDVSVPTPQGELSISRSHSTFDGPTAAGYSVFGPGWRASFEGDDNGAASYTVVDSTTVDGTIAFLDEEGDALVYREPGSKQTDAPAGTYAAVDDDTKAVEAAVTVTGSGTTRKLVMTEADGTKTTFKIATSADARFRWVTESVAQPGSLGSTSYTSDANGRITRILAPVQTGVTCGTTLARGCRALEITYAGTTGNGDYKDQVSTIEYNAWDPASSTVKKTPVATYTYDSTGKLTKVTDPRTGQFTTYGYDSGSGADFPRLASIQDSGQAAYGFTYTTGDDVRLAKVTRGGWASGKATSTLQSYVYHVPVTGTGLPNLSDTSVARWHQGRVPVEGAAVFDPDTNVSSTDPANITAAQWQHASIQYTDADGYTVNTASYGAGDWQLTATDYDQTGNVTRSFDARGLRAVIDRIAADPTDDFDAGEYATISRYNAAGTIAGTQVAAGMFVTDTWAPAQDTAPLSDADHSIRARAHTHYTYDEGAPNGGKNPGSGLRWGLVTTVTVGAADPESGSSEPADTIPADLENVSTTKTGYDLINPVATTNQATDPTSGWVLGQATTSTLVTAADGTGITTKTRYDALGSTVESRTPLSAGGDEGATQTIYYTAGTNPDDAACGNKPEWAGLTCWTGAGTPATGPDLPDTRTTGYSYWLAPTLQVESSGTGASQTTRTTTTTYDAAGRELVTDTDLDGATAAERVPAAKTIYDDTTGMVVKTQSLKSDGTVDKESTTAYDLWGRVTSTTSDQGQPTTTTYVDPASAGAGQVATVTDPKGTITYTYDGTDANGKAEQRGLVTKMTVSGVGTYTAAYDDQGSMIVQNAPGGITETYMYDDLGRLTDQAYQGQRTDDTGTVSTGEWLGWARDYDFQGRVTTENVRAPLPDAPAAFSRSYAYDKAGRLTTATDTGTGDCVTRDYTFDRQGNRTKLTTTGPGTDGSCGSGTAATTWTYDLSSRTQTGANGAGAYVYDQLGRITSMPAADAPDSSTGNITLGYFESDQPRTITQGNTQTAFTLDTAGRRLAETTTVDGQVTSTLTRYYTDDSDNPSWVTKQTPGQDAETTRYTPALGDGLGSTTRPDGTVAIDITDPHGDVVTTVPVPSTGNATGISGWSVFDEYGNPETTADTTPVDTGNVAYGWLGSHERATESTGLILMGARLYNPTVGRFTSLDPTPGGNENAYNYPNDPINKFDTSGNRWSWGRFWRTTATVAAIAGGVAGAIACGMSVVCGIAVGAAAGAALYTARNGFSKRFKWRGLAMSAAFGAAGGALRYPAGAVGGRAMFNNRALGVGSRLFGRSRVSGVKGAWNSGRVRAGWGWKGKANAGKHVFRVSWSKPGNRTRFNHVDLFWRRGR